MKIINARIHGIVDYLVVLFLLISPGLFGFYGAVSALTYTVAVVHFVLTVSTNFQLGLVRVLSFKIHGWVELSASIALVGAPWIIGFSSSTMAIMFYTLFGITVFVVWLLTDYSDW